MTDDVPPTVFIVGVIGGIYVGGTVATVEPVVWDFFVFPFYLLWDVATVSTNALIFEPIGLAFSGAEKTSYSIPVPVAVGILLVTASLSSRAVGPGWLPHSSCPHCCWCSGDVPFGTRVEKRLWDFLRGLTR